MCQRGPPGGSNTFASSPQSHKSAVTGGLKIVKDGINTFN